MSTLLQDIRYGLRMLAKNPGFTAVAVLTLALGIGANTAIFSLIDTIMLKLLPVRNPEQLYVVSHSGTYGINEISNYPLFEHLRDHNHVFSEMCAVNQNEWKAEANGVTEIVRGQVVTGNYYSVLGVNAIVGRTFTPDDDKIPGGNPVAVISYSFWQRRFGLDAEILGKTVSVNLVPFTIVGVTPPEFFGLQPGWVADVTVLMSMHDLVGSGATLNARAFWWPLDTIGRLKRGMSATQARADLDILFKQFLSSDVSQWRRHWSERIELTPLASGLPLLHRQFSTPLRFLMIVVGLLLLVACANVANLLLARSVARQREVAIRLVIGASVLRIVRQLLTESVLLTALGGALGVWLALYAGNLLLKFLPQSGVPLMLHVVPDERILGFTAVLSVLTAILFGVVPAFRATQIGMNPALKNSPQNMLHSGSRVTLDKALVAAQVAVCVLLLVGAGLFIRSLQKLRRVDTGFSRHNVLLFSVDVYGTQYAKGARADHGARLLSVYRRVLERIQHLPGVRSVSISTMGPLGGGEWRPVSIASFVPRSEAEQEVGLNRVGPKYFATMGIPLLLGRDFDEQDESSSTKVAVVSESMARFYFPGENPLGKRFDISTKTAGGEYTIVGVVKDAKFAALRAENPHPRVVFLPYFQDIPFPWMTVVIRTATSPESLIPAVTRQVREVGSDIPIRNVRTLEVEIDESLVQERLIATLSGCFSGLATLLACIGLYGVISYNVTRRTSEIGIRMALGAKQSDVLGLVVGQGVILTLIGVALGLAGAFLLTRFLSSLLFGIRPTDPATFVAVSVLLTAVALLASYIPARRATKVDPMVALRYE